MSRPRFEIAHHAVERFIERCDPSLTPAEVRAYFVEAMPRLHYVGRRNTGTDAGHLYRDPERPMLAEFVAIDGAIVTVTNPQKFADDAEHVEKRVAARGRR